MKKTLTIMILLTISFGLNAQEKIQTEVGLKTDFVYKNVIELGEMNKKLLEKINSILQHLKK